MTNRYAPVLGFVSLLALSQPAFGQEANDDAMEEDSSQAGDDMLDTVVVTARRTTENLQDVPIAVTVVSGEELAKRQILDVKGLEMVTPNLVINPNAVSAGGANIFIRGVGTADFDRTFSPAVSLVVDGVIFGSSIAGQLLNVVDVERVEVLRGPQGTLFGANSIGGVINITRPKPKDEFAGEAQVTVGNFGEFNLRGSLTGPIVPGKIDARIAVNSVTNDGQFTNDFNGENRGFVDLLVVSPSLRFTPSDDVEILLQYDYLRNEGDWGVLFNRSNPTELMCIGVVVTDMPRCADPNQDLSRTNQDTPTFLRTTTHSVNLTANITAGDVDITSISGFNLFEEDKQTDFDGVPIPTFASIQPVTERQFMQEFRANWTVNDRLRILGGLFGQFVDYQDGANSLFVFELLGFPPDTVEIVDRQQTTYSFGAYLTGDYRVTDELRISLGGRYTYEYKDFIYRNGFNQTGGGFFPETEGFDNVAADTQGWSQFTPRIAIDYQPREDMLIYASYSQGFRSGGFNGRGNSTETIGPYDPELVDTYELGLKSEWFNRRLRFNLAGFLTDYTDKQEEVIRRNPETGATITTVTNAAAVRYWGIEAEIMAVVAEGLTVSGTGGYLNARYRDFIFNDFDVTDFVEPRNAPEFQVSGTVQYETQVTDNVALDALVTYRWTDSYFFHLGPRFDGGGPSPLINDPRGFIDDFGLLDGQIGLTFDAGGREVRASVYGRNLTDERFFQTFAPVANLWANGTPNLGRTYGVRLGVSF
ncbi:TonB-dependent receptor [Alterisphingorhabdus coralli]|uniref:TonB-dependent receptor n=1 Tax=Alterisphingorhabdus coralli TaxID=3071408 RepID=A0AA97F820_9SPHN|nr:TonB-dependent receptor [Parasphingorhabdus sp. SCSIO 66989]WOE75646.1 TonB-dependent receptor [Parasphingorhabdus sp. SCSIO 66989]